jgi:hypothetical protein
VGHPIEKGGHQKSTTKVKIKAARKKTCKRKGGRDPAHTPRTTPESMAITDVGALRLTETMDLVATGLDVNIAVAVTESFGAYPHDSHRRAVRALAGVCNQAHAMEVKQAVLVAKEVQLHPWDGGQRDKTKATYTFRLLQSPLRLLRSCPTLLHPRRRRQASGPI